MKPASRTGSRRSSGQANPRGQDRNRHPSRRLPTRTHCFVLFFTPTPCSLNILITISPNILITFSPVIPITLSPNTISSRLPLTLP